MGSRIVDDCLKKAQEAEDQGDIEKANYWLKKAEDTEVLLDKMWSKNANKSV